MPGATRCIGTRRAFRNRLVIGSLIAAGGVATLVVLQLVFDDADIVAQPESTTGISRLGLMFLVMAFGTIGGLLSAVPALAAVPTAPGPYNFPLQQAILKIVLGALTGLVGVIVTGTTGATAVHLARRDARHRHGVRRRAAVTDGFLDKRAGQIVANAAAEPTAVRSGATAPGAAGRRSGRSGG